MKHSIESTSLRIEVNSVGIELSSIQSKLTHQEYLWQGNPDIWAGQAPVLFPIVGALKDGRMIHNGISYVIPKHGFVRESSKPKLIDSGENFLRFGLRWDEESLEVYPFKFDLELKFLLDENTLHIQHQITNEGDEPMLYSIGGHPAFNCPLYPTESYEEYSLEFAEKETDSTCLVDPSGLISLESMSMLDHSYKIQLHPNLFEKDALVFKNLKSRKVSLVHQSKGPVLSVDFEDFNYLGIWAKPAAPFVCIEPWLGIADYVDSNQNLAEKDGILVLPPAQMDTKSFSITILK